MLQGDSLSPLLFNMSFNTFIQHIQSEKYTQLGFWNLNKIGISFNPMHWFQFADDAVVITSEEKHNQILLNCFSIWCQWANMKIRVDKCSTFGIQKHSTKSIQYKPNLLINNKLVPRIKIGESFLYLGRYFDFDMSDEKHKSELYQLFIRNTKHCKTPRHFLFHKTRKYNTLQTPRHFLLDKIICLHLYELVMAI